MSRKHTEASFKKRLWISVENMLSEAARDEIGLRYEQAPDLWIVRLASAINWPPAPECAHVWSRRRDGSACNRCGTVRFGEFK